MENILITGINGFLGSIMAKYFANNIKYKTIIGVNRFKRDNYRIAHTMGNIKNLIMAYGDVSNYEFITSIINTYEIDVVFHFGAQSIVSRAELDPRNTFISNVIGTSNILEACRQNKVKGIITISSDKIYSHISPPYYEDITQISPGEVYSTSKLCSDIITRCYGKNFYIPCIVLRPCNYFGPCDFNFSRIIPRSIIRSLEGKRPQIWKGVINYQREFIYIDDVVQIIYKLMSKLLTSPEMCGEAYNLGSGVIYKIGDLVKQISDLIDPNLGIEIANKDFEFKEIQKQWLDSTKMYNILEGNVPNRTKLDFTGCLLDTIKWYKEYFK